MSEENLSITYALSQRVNYGDIVIDASRYWADLRREGSASRKYAERAGIDVLSLPENFSDGLSITKSSAGLDQSVVDLIISFVSGTVAPMVANGIGRVSLDVWTEVILPQLRRKHHDDVLTEKERKSSPDDGEKNKDAK